MQLLCVPGFEEEFTMPESEMIRSNDAVETGNRGGGGAGLYNNLDMNTFSTANPDRSDTVNRFLPKLDMAGLTDRCAELGSDAGPCVKAIRRQGLA